MLLLCITAMCYGVNQHYDVYTTVVYIVCHAVALLVHAICTALTVYMC
jgi:hypothetical protein